MDGGIFQGLCTIGGLVIVNIVVVAYSYGKSTQQLADLCRRVTKLENKIKNGGA